MTLSTRPTPPPELIARAERARRYSHRVATPPAIAFNAALMLRPARS